jgi:hypothetical protein
VVTVAPLKPGPLATRFRPRGRADSRCNAQAYDWADGAPQQRVAVGTHLLARRLLFREFLLQAVYVIDARTDLLKRRGVVCIRPRACKLDCTGSSGQRRDGARRAQHLGALGARPGHQGDGSPARVRILGRTLEKTKISGSAAAPSLCRCRERPGRRDLISRQGLIAAVNEVRPGFLGVGRARAPLTNGVRYRRLTWDSRRDLAIKGKDEIFRRRQILAIVV